MNPPPLAQPMAEDTALMRVMRRIASLLENLIAALIAAVFLLCLALVILRYAFSIGFAGAEELMRFLFVYSTALGASVAILRGEPCSLKIGDEFVVHLLSSFESAQRKPMSPRAVVGLISVRLVTRN